MTISSTGKYMLVQFLTDGEETFKGFTASFHWMPIDANCVNWLNMAANVFESPEYPTINCSWVITAPSIYSGISINFETFEVNEPRSLNHAYQIASSDS